MENKKSFVIIFTSIISAHLLLFANLIVEEKVVLPQNTAAPKIPNINLKNVVLKKPEPVVEKVVEKPIEVIKPLPLTKSKNIVKHEEKIKKHVKKDKPKKLEEKPVEKVEIVEHVEEVKPQVQKEVVQTQKPVDLDQIQALENEYLSKLRRLIEENKTYPRAAKRLNQMGKVHISFVISKDGQIRNAKIVRDSSYERLNDAALEILSKIEKFEPIPEKLNKNSWEITVPIIYEITRS